MSLIQLLKDVFGPKAQPAERVYPAEMYSEEVSKPGATIRVCKIHLTRQQHESLRVKRDVHIPGVAPSKP